MSLDERYCISQCCLVQIQFSIIFFQPPLAWCCRFSHWYTSYGPHRPSFSDTIRQYIRLGSDVCVLCSVCLFMIFKIVLSNPANNCDLFKILFLKPQQLLPVIPCYSLTAVWHWWKRSLQYVMHMVLFMLWGPFRVAGLVCGKMCLSESKDDQKTIHLLFLRNIFQLWRQILFCNSEGKKRNSENLVLFKRFSLISCSCINCNV